MTLKPLIAVRNLTKTFASGQKAIDDVDFDVGQGEILTLLGPSGCGKTTILRCLAGFETPTGGSITIGGVTMSSGERGVLVPPERRGVGFVHQTYALWPHMSVFDTVAYALELRGKPRREREKLVKRALELVRLGGLEARLPSELSGGQQQRVALARSIAYDPSVVLLDEPLSNLDVKLREHTRLELRRLFKELQATAVYVTHDQAEAMAIADRCIVMSNGRIQQIGTPLEVYSNPANTFVADFMGSSNIFRAATSDTSSGTVDIGWGSFAVRHPRPDTASVCIKPKDVMLVADGTADNSFEAKVIARSFLGDFFKIVVAPTAALSVEIALHVFQYDAAPPAESDVVWARFPPQHLQPLAS